MSDGENQKADMTPAPSPRPSSSGSCTCTPPPCLCTYTNKHTSIRTHTFIGLEKKPIGQAVWGTSHATVALRNAPVCGAALGAVEVEDDEDVEGVEAEVGEGEPRRDAPVQGRDGQEEVGQHLEEDVAGEGLGALLGGGGRTK